VAEGTDALVLTAGDVTLTDGDLVLTAGDALFGEDVTITGSILGVVGVDASGTVSANLFTPDAADGADIGSATLEFSDVYLADGSIIKGQNDQSATLTSSASTWTASNFAVAGTLGVTGVTTLAGVAEGTDALVLTLGDITVTDGDINVTAGDATFGEDVDVTGVLTLAGVAEGTDALTLTLGDITITDGDINVTAGDASFGEDVTVTGTTTLNGIADGGTAFGTGLTVDGTTLKTHAALQSIAGQTEADVSILETTADNTYNVVTSGGNLYVLRANSGNTALEFAAPSGTGSPVNTISASLVTPNIGAATGTSFTAAKSDGVGGAMGVYEVNSTDTSQTGWKGAASIADDQWFQFSNDDPAADQVMVFGAPSTNVSAITWKYHGQVTSVVDADGGDADAYCYGGVWMATGEGIIALPAVAVGMQITIENHTASDVTIEPDGTDAIKLNGAAILADGVNIVGTDIGDTCVLTYMAAGDWSAFCYGYIEGS